MDGVRIWATRQGELAASGSSQAPPFRCLSSVCNSTASAYGISRTGPNGEAEFMHQLAIKVYYLGDNSGWLGIFKHAIAREHRFRSKFRKRRAWVPCRSQLTTLLSAMWICSQVCRPHTPLSR